MTMNKLALISQFLVKCPKIINAAFAGRMGGRRRRPRQVMQIESLEIRTLLSTMANEMLVSSAEPAPAGRTVTFTATISSPLSGTPTGTVDFMDGATLLTTANLSNGVATYATSSLTVGTHPITVVYSGDANFIGGTSPTVYQHILPGPIIAHGTTIDVYGTADVNEFALVDGVFANGSQYVVAYVNGISNGVVVDGGYTFVFHGTGADSFLYIGSTYNESAVLNPSGVALASSAGYSMNASGMNSITLNGGGGVDTATIYAADGIDDMFIGTSSYAQMAGAGYTTTVYGFPTVTAIDQFPTHGTHTARFYDSEGNDTFIGKPAFSQMYGVGFNNVAIGYPEVMAVNSDNTPGAVHLAYLYTSNANDLFQATPTYGQLSGTGFSNIASGYSSLYAINTDATSDVSHAAQLYGSSAQDTFIGTTTYGQLYGAGYSNWAFGFTSVAALGTSGGNDIAYQYGSTAADTFIGTSTYGQMLGTTYNNIAYSFSQVYMIGVAGGTAYLYDGPGNDVLYARNNYAVLEGAGFFNDAIGFTTVNAYAINGGIDIADTDNSLTFTLNKVGNWL